MLTAGVLFNHHFLHWRTDLRSGKMSPVVVLGERRALRVSGWLAAAGYAALVPAIATGCIPATALVALITARWLFLALAQARRSPGQAAHLGLMRAALEAAARTGWIAVGAVALSRRGGLASVAGD